MDTNRLRYFCTIAECGSLTKASALLRISHSGLSKAMSLLEQELEISLFRPKGRGLEITDEGKEIYESCRSILRSVDELKRKRTLEPEALRIGLSEVFAVTCSHQILEGLGGQRKVDFYESTGGDLELQILQRKLDFGFGFVPFPNSDIDHLKIGSLRFNAYATESLQSASEPEEIPFVVPTSFLAENPMSFRNRDGWPDEVARRSHCRASHFSLALNLLISGKAAFYAPDFVAALENGKLAKENKVSKIKYFKRAQTTRDVFLVKLAVGEETKEMKQACRVIRRFCD